MNKKDLAVSFTHSSASNVFAMLSPQDKALSSHVAHYFLSLPWLDGWLSTLPPDFPIMMVRVFERSTPERARALALFGITSRRVLGVRVSQWHLFRSGVPEYDQIWVEYNQVLRGHDDLDDEHYLWSEIAKSKRVDEIHMGVMHHVPDRPAPWCCEQINSEKSLQYNTQSVAPVIKSGLAKRIKAFRNLPLSLRLLERVDDGGFESLVNASLWHIEKWRNSETPSGFSNPAFIAFHRHLWQHRDHYPEVKPRIFELHMNGAKTAVLYGFQQGGWFGFYCLCHAPQPDNRLRTGLYFHSILQEFLFKEGMLAYDFMAGTEDYKFLLSNEQINACQLRWYRPTVVMTVEQMLKTLKSRIKRYLRK